MPRLRFRQPAPLVAAGLLIGALLFSAALATARTTMFYNSEEHQLIVDRGVALVKVPTSVKLPANVTFGHVEAAAYQDYVRKAKRLAVGFDSNKLSDFVNTKEGVQDNCYYPPTFGQLSGNQAIYVPDIATVPTQVLQVAGYTKTGSSTQFTMGHLASLYGDYRRTTYCDGTGRCFLTQADVDTVAFTRGNARTKFCPAAVPAGDYLQAIGSGLNPPAGPVGNVTANTAYTVNDRFEAGWWGDEMLRIANINDWHFANGAIAWYVGAHRLALLYADSARGDPRYWVKALHLEANALHSLTDLFAFGHVVTNRDVTSHGIMVDNEPTPGTGSKWMKNVLELGGGSRDGGGTISLSSNLPAIREVTGTRNDFVPSKRYGWWDNAKAEHTYHNEFNSKGAYVRNLNGDEFQIFGDGRLGAMVMTSKSVNVLVEAVRTSVQSLFDAQQQLAAGGTVENIGKAGSSYFGALRLVPVYIMSDGNNYFTGRWTRYAKAIDEISGGKRVPTTWESCAVAYLSGADWKWPTATTTACTAF